MSKLNDFEMNYSVFKDNLKHLIESRGMSAKGLGEEINSTAATISRYLTGDRTPDLPYAIRISKYFDVSLDWLLGISGDRYEVLPKDVQDVVFLYQLATPEDRKVIQTLLSKYQ